MLSTPDREDVMHGLHDAEKAYGQQGDVLDQSTGPHDGPPCSEEGVSSLVGFWGIPYATTVPAAQQKGKAP